MEETETQATGYRELTIIYLKGFAMGAADAVPGVSGGTIALITGIYERLIQALTELDPSIVTYLSGVHRAKSRSELWKNIEEMDLPFLFALGLGMVSAVIVIARLIHRALETVPGPTFAFFAGLIGASAVVLGEREWIRKRWTAVACLLGFSIAFLIAGASSAGIFPHSLPMIFLAGAIAICGMVLPGISGAFILLLLGQYEYLTQILTRFVDGLIGLGIGRGTENLWADGAVVGTFIGGAFVGLLSTAYVVRWALEHHRKATFAFLVSLMIGALRYPVVQIAEGEPTVAGLVPILLAALFGIGLVVVLDHYTDDLEYEDAERTASQL